MYVKIDDYVINTDKIDYFSKYSDGTYCMTVNDLKLKVSSAVCNQILSENVPSKPKKKEASTKKTTKNK